VSRKILIALVAPAAVISVCACGGKSASGDSTPGQSASAGGWTTVATVTGDGSAVKDSAVFATHGGKVRVVFTVQPNSTGPVPLKWAMFKEGMPVGPLGVIEDSCVSCDGEHAGAPERVAAGSYYVHVLTSGPWTLRIEEAR
jgi:hypothetical protein